MPKIKLSFEFDDLSDAKCILNANEMHLTLWDISNNIRNKLKYSEEKWLTEEVRDYLEELRELAHTGGVLDD